ncbi:MAG: phospho-N-acetylmuramoyl-pentapeptide-transferase [Clostridiaceae bacterium]|nr:phospho-N-acetylmuramoyl-pentapeptide-transferase [Clostridiaceae bacterium]
MILLNALVIFILTLFVGRTGLPIIRRLQLRQTVRSDGPKSHFKKSGTPTFGGLFFLIPMGLSAIILPIINPNWLIYSVIMLLTLAFGLVGFIDDYIKVRVDKEGLSVLQKTIFLLAVCISFSVWYLWFSNLEIIIHIPFIEEGILVTGNWKYLYMIFIILYLFFMANAVNITDGVDGLVSTLMTITSLSLAILLYIVFKEDMKTPYLIAACLALAAGCLGFLPFNKNPAKIFMGDTGSQALGACFAVIALLAGVPWIMLFLGLIYILEALSTLIQVIYFKLTNGKRIFKMAPLHHHFELSGWTEKKVVTRFSVFTLICGGLSLLLLLL